MDKKLIEDFEAELAAHSAALEKAGDLLNRQDAQIKELHAAYESETETTARMMKRITELEAEISESCDDVGRAEMEAAAMVSALKYIVNLSNGWNLDGSTGPGMIAGVRMSWETLARLAMDCARSAVSVERRDYKCAQTGEIVTQVLGGESSQMNA